MDRRTMVVTLALALAAPGIALGADKAKEQAEVRKAAQDALNAVYKAAPSAKKAVESAAGYAAFSNFGMKIFVAGGGSGKGIAVNNKTKATTYMRMAEIQAGLGFGIKKFQLVWVFETDAALNNFINSYSLPSPAGNPLTGANKTFTVAITKVAYWDGNANPVQFADQCPASDKGAQRLSLTVASVHYPAVVEQLQVVKRK